MTRIALVVEDDADLRLLARLRLTELGWSVLEASSVQEAKDRLGADDVVDVVLLDLRLGPDDGRELLDWMNSSQRTGPGVVVVSATAGPEAVADTRSRGAVAYIEKPYTTKELSEALARAGEG